VSERLVAALLQARRETRAAELRGRGSGRCHPDGIPEDAE
jgi:hypothetical protein